MEPLVVSLSRTLTPFSTTAAFPSDEPTLEDPPARTAFAPHIATNFGPQTRITEVASETTDDE